MEWLIDNGADKRETIMPLYDHVKRQMHGRYHLVTDPRFAITYNRKEKHIEQKYGSTFSFDSLEVMQELNLSLLYL